MITKGALEKLIPLLTHKSPQLSEPAAYSLGSLAVNKQLYHGGFEV